METVYSREKSKYINFNINNLCGIIINENSGLWKSNIQRMINMLKNGVYLLCNPLTLIKGIVSALTMRSSILGGLK